jgi:hypothetical protein
MASDNDRRPLLPAILSPNGKAPSQGSLTPYGRASLPARPAPTVPLPYIDGNMSRRKLAKLRNRLSEITATTNAATGVQGALTAFEAARQETEKVHAARRLLPLALEADRLRVVADIVRAHADLDAAMGELEQRRIEREKNALLVPLQMEQLRGALEQDIAAAQAAAEEHRAQQQDLRARRDRHRQSDVVREALDREEAEIRRMELAARRREAEARLRQAGTLGELRGQAERFKAETETHRAQAEAEKMRRAVTPSPTDSIPETLREHLAAELEVNRNRAPAVQLAQEIRERAKAAKRPLTPEEAEIVDLLESAAASAADSIRRGAASDFEE